MRLLELEDPPGGVPDYSKEHATKVEAHRSQLTAGGVKWMPLKSSVMAEENTLLELLDTLTFDLPLTVVLDISALPKRYFCFFIRRLLASHAVQNVIVTYTQAGDEGYTTDHLTEDVMTPDTFPGFAGSLKHDHTNLVVAVGFEALGLRSLIISLQRDVNRDLRLILPFPAPIDTVRRQWQTLREITENDPANLRRSNIAVVAAWDTELVYRTLSRWNGPDSNLSLAPFGPKTHTLAMALFAAKNDASLWYTQPKVYHPDYTRGIGDTWWYAIKWRGSPCFDR